MTFDRHGNDQPDATTLKPGDASYSVDVLAMRRIANIAHHGGLIGLGDVYEAMNEIRKLSLPYWDKTEAERLQRDNAEERA